MKKNSGIPWIGEIPEEWKLCKTKHHFSVIAGATPKSEICEYWDGPIPWITPADYKTNDKYVSCGRKSLTQIGYDSCAASLVPAGSIIFSKRAPVGTVAIASNDLCTNQGCLSCVAKDDSVDSLYYYYTMSIFTEQFELVSTGTTFKEIPADTFSNFYLPYPSFSEQKRIANLLDGECVRIDAVMEQTRASIEEYKKLKQSIITEAVTKGIRPNRPMKDSGIDWIGQIPEDWEVRPMKSYIDILPGYAFSSDDFNTENGVRLLRGINVSPNQIKWNETVFWNKPITKQLEQFLLREKDLVVGLDRPWISEGTRVAFITEEDLPCLLLQRVCRIRIKKEMDSRFVYHVIAGKAFEDALSTDTTGVSVPHISTKQIQQFVLAMPSLKEQQEICDYLEEKGKGVDVLLAQKEQLLTELESFKKSLIYEYVTGRKEVISE